MAPVGVASRIGEPLVMTGVHQAQFLAEFTVEQAKKSQQRAKPFFIHTTPVMPHWGTCIGSMEKEEELELENGEF